MSLFASAFLLAVHTAEILALAWLVIIPLELAFPRGGVSWMSRLRALAYWSVSIPVWSLFTAAFTIVWRQLGVTPLLPVGVHSGIAWLDIAAAVILGNVLSDFFFYWRHRLQHVLFWRFHAVHHSIEELSGLSSYHHISEEAFRVMLTVVPLVVVFGPHQTMLVAVAGSIVGTYIHSNTRVAIGPLRYLIIEPAMHRIHHSTDPRHFGKNFGAFTPLWDVLFGTAYFPAKDEWPATGLADRPEPDGIVEWLAAPWHKREDHERGKAAVGTV